MATTRIRLRAIAPGQRIVKIEGKKLRGPRGGRYEFRAIEPLSPAEFVSSTLSPDGSRRVFHFANAQPLEVADSLSCLLVAVVEVQS